MDENASFLSRPDFFHNYLDFSSFFIDVLEVRTASIYPSEDQTHFHDILM